MLVGIQKKLLLFEFRGVAERKTMRLVGKSECDQVRGHDMINRIIESNVYLGE